MNFNKFEAEELTPRLMSTLTSATDFLIEIRASAYSDISSVSFWNIAILVFSFISINKELKNYKHQVQINPSIQNWIRYQDFICLKSSKKMQRIEISGKSMAIFFFSSRTKESCVEGPIYVRKMVKQRETRFFFRLSFWLI